MNRDNDVSAVLQQYAAETGVHSVQKVEQDFVTIAQQVPAETVTDGLAEAMHSEQTPPFHDMLCDSYARGDTVQREGMLARLLAFTGQDLHRPHADGRVGGLPEPEVFRQIAREAAERDPAVIDKMSEFYAIDPVAGKTLGGVALSIALGKMAER